MRPSPLQKPTGQESQMEQAPICQNPRQNKIYVYMLLEMAKRKVTNKALKNTRYKLAKTRARTGKALMLPIEE